MQSVIQHLQACMRRLPFSPDALSSLDHVPLSVNLLEFVLRDVPLCAREIEVCRALNAWAAAQEDYSSDEDEGSEEKLLGVESRLLDHIDLTALSPDDLCKVRAALCSVQCCAAPAPQLGSASRCAAPLRAGACLRRSRFTSALHHLLISTGLSRSPAYNTTLWRSGAVVSSTDWLTSLAQRIGSEAQAA